MFSGTDVEGGGVPVLVGGVPVLVGGRGEPAVVEVGGAPPKVMDGGALAEPPSPPPHAANIETARGNRTLMSPAFVSVETKAGLIKVLFPLAVSMFAACGGGEGGSANAPPSITLGGAPPTSTTAGSPRPPTNTGTPPTNTGTPPPSTSVPENICKTAPAVQTDPSPANDAPKQFVYALNQQSGVPGVDYGNIAAFTINATTGALSPVAGSPFS